MKDSGMDRAFHMHEGEIQYVLFGNPETRRTPGRHKRSWKVSIKMDIDEMQWMGGVQGILLAQGGDQSGIL